MQINIFIIISMSLCLLHNVNAYLSEKQQVSSPTYDTPSSDLESISEKYYLKQELNKNDRNNLQKRSLTSSSLTKRMNQRKQMIKRQSNGGEGNNNGLPTTAITNNDPTKVVHVLLNTVTGLLNQIGLGINPNETLSLNNVVNELTGHVTNLNGDHELLNDKDLIGLIRTLISDVDQILGSKGCKEDLSGKLDLDGEDDDDDKVKRDKLNNDTEKDTEKNGDSDNDKEKDKDNDTDTDNDTENDTENDNESDNENDSDDEKKKVKRENSNNGNEDDDNDDESESDNGGSSTKNGASADKCDNNSGRNNFELLEQVLGFVKNLLLNGKGTKGQVPVVLQTVTKLVKAILGNTTSGVIQKTPVASINNNNPNTNTAAKRSLLRRALIKNIIEKRK